jgi:hypothetical protein
MKQKISSYLGDMLLISFVLLLLSGCTRVIHVPTEVVEGYPQVDKINLIVELRLGERLRDAKWEKSVAGRKYVVPLGKAFPQNAEAVARKIFSDVVVTETISGPPRSDVDAILAPMMVSIEQTPDRVLTGVIFEWVMKDINGNTIWTDTIRGRAEKVEIVGSIFASKKEQVDLKIKKLIDDIFKRSFYDISSSAKIKEFETQLHKSL